jgi:hypothetical protein
MWTRFNFFVVIEPALIGGRFIAGDGKLIAELAIVGAVLSLVWYIFGIQDRKHKTPRGQIPRVLSR